MCERYTHKSKPWQSKMLERLRGASLFRNRTRTISLPIPLVELHPPRTKVRALTIAWFGDEVTFQVDEGHKVILDHLFDVTEHLIWLTHISAKRKFVVQVAEAPVEPITDQRAVTVVQTR